MRVLFVASECAPFVKTGGLADVVGSLPKVLSKIDMDVRVLLPAYQRLKPFASDFEDLISFDDFWGGPARVLAGEAEGIALFLLDADHLFGRDGNPYTHADGSEWPDNAVRFAALCKVATDLSRTGFGDWIPDVVHAHDWHAGLVPLYMTQEGSSQPSVFSIHNIGYQGVYGGDVAPQLGLQGEGPVAQGYAHVGGMSFLKAGIALADEVTTVSPTYAFEITTPEFGMGMETAIGARENVTGILNGIDTDVWDPATDSHLVANYSPTDLDGKRICKSALCEAAGFGDPDAGPLLCLITRLTPQKGIDLFLDALPGVLDLGARVIVLGSGDKALEADLWRVHELYEGKVHVTIGYDEAYAHQIQAGSDAILVPSRFEPCGLTQLIGLRYGTIPIVSRTGGLADTVIDANEAAMISRRATGIQFSPITAHELYHAVARLIPLYADRDAWQKMVVRAMTHPVGWDKSALLYKDLYQRLLDRRGGEQGYDRDI